MRSRSRTVTLDKGDSGGEWHMNGWSRARAAARSATGAAVVVVLVLVTTHLALQVPGLRVLAPFSPAALLGYDRLLGELSPLSDDYIRRVLGLDVAPPEPPAAPLAAAAGGGGVSGSADPAVDAGPGPAPGDEGVAAQELRHEFTNDDFARAVHPARLPFIARTNTARASREPGEPGSCSPVGGTAWYAFRPARDMTLVADTFGTSYANALGVFRGTSLTRLEEVGCSRGVTGNAHVSFRATAGQAYWFQVTGPAGGGALTFSLTPLGATSRASLTDDDRQSNGYQHPLAAVTPDGRYVAFTGAAENLGSPSCGDAGFRMRAWCSALFLRDRITGTTTMLLSTSPRRPNTQDDELHQVATPDRWSYYPYGVKFSADSRYITFNSDDPTLVPGDQNGIFDVFAFDRLTSRLERVSVSSEGEEGTRNAAALDRAAVVSGSYGASMSADGRFVVFTSSAEGLVPDDTNQWQDVFVRDRTTGRTERVSVSTGGKQVDGPSTSSSLQAISGDGRYVVFTSWAADMAPGTAGARCAAELCLPNVFLHDRLRRTTTLLSRTPSGGSGDAASDHPSISADGRFVAFTSAASDLVRDDTNGVHDVFRVDVRTHRIMRLSVSSDGQQQQTPPYGTDDQAHRTADIPIVSLSADGRYVAFASAAPNLVPGDGNSALDVFVHDAVTRSTSRLSVTETGGDADGDSFNPFLTADGRSIVFISAATNLVAGDTNHANDVFVHDSRVVGRA